MRIVFLFLMTLLWSAPAFAFEEFFTKYCEGTKVPVELAKAVARQESGMKPLCLNVAGKDYFPESRAEAIKIIKKAHEKKQSYDVGLMQINSRWIKSWGMDPASLLDPETNIRLGISLLKDEISRHGLNWRAVGGYHSPNIRRARHYAGMVYNRIKGDKELKNKLTRAKNGAPLFPAPVRLDKLEPLNIVSSGQIGQPDISMRKPVL